jgi:copper chaperone CopZ
MPLRSLFALTLIAAPLSAELLHVELSVGGLDCVSCAQSVDRVLKRIKGVDAASFRTADSVAVLDMKPGAAVTMEQIRDAVKGIGYTPLAAKVTVRGEVRQYTGKLLLRVAPDVEYTLNVPPGVAMPGTGTSIVEGSFADAAAPLKVSAVRRE